MNKTDKESALLMFDTLVSNFPEKTEDALLILIYDHDTKKLSASMRGYQDRLEASLYHICKDDESIRNAVLKVAALIAYEQMGINLEDEEK